LKFYASLRLESGASAPSRMAIGCRQPHESEGGQEQSRAAVPRVEFDIMYGEGISREGDLLDLAVTSASWKERRVVLLQR